MKRKVIDNSEFPSRKVVSVRDPKKGGMAEFIGVDKLATLECDHTIGIRVGFDVPADLPCYLCYKEAKR